MKKLIYFIIFINTFYLSALDEEIKEKAFLVNAVIDVQNNEISFSWNYQNDTKDIYVRKKMMNEEKFDVIDTLNGNSTEFIDKSAKLDQICEYSFIKKIIRDNNQNSKDTIFSYAYPIIGYEISPVHKQGSVLILIDSTVYEPLINDLQRLKHDLIGEGWKVYLQKAPRSELFNKNAVEETKEIVKSIYEIDPNLKTVLLFGRLAVPYSGVLTPDGHGDHVGAWPCDAYYGDIDGNWDDFEVDYSSNTIMERIHNVPGDGKFDNNLIPSDIDIAIGRVDLYDLPYFQEDEITLLKNYLEKDHDYRTGKIAANDSAIVNDNFGAAYRESFGAGGLMNFYTLFDDRVNTEGYLRKAIQDSNRSFKWIYGCGPGSFTGANNIVYSAEFAEMDHNAIFTMIFGSYHGDWDFRNNLLRSALASKPSILTAAWSGRPTWFFHKMLFGKTIGESAKLSQNYTFEEYPSVALWGDRVIHIALMGDPTLRQHIVDPIETIFVEQISDFEIRLDWEYNEINDGFYIYRSNSIDGNFELLNEYPVEMNSFTDKKPLQGQNYYMVRVNKLEKHHYGSYYNLSTGKIIDNNFELPEIANIYPNPASEFFTIYLKDDIENAYLEIFDLTGRKVVEYNLPNQSGYILEKFYLSGETNLAQGNYILRIKGDDFSSDNILSIVK